MTIKFQLDPKPTFDAVVKIPLHGDDKTADFKFTFAHKSNVDLEEFIANISKGDKTKLDALKEIASGWELTDEWNDENLTKLLNNYNGSFTAIMDVYISELRQFKLKN